MTYYNFTIKGQINAEAIDEAADILEIHMDDLGSTRSVLIGVSFQDESVATKKIEQQDIKPKKPTQEQMTGGY